MANNKKYVELLWAEKYDKLEKGEKIPIERPNLPFQVVETVNKPRIKGGITAPLFPEDEWPEDYPKDWKNLLIWGDNKLVMSSLIKQGWAGKINLIYIDPPFFTGADFSIRTTVGGEQVEKEPSIIEERAYSDTWSGGISSYLKYMYERLILMRELLAENGSIYVHLDWHVGHYVKVMMDEIFGYENFRNEIIVKRIKKNVNEYEMVKSLNTDQDIVLFYSKTLEVKILPPLKRIFEMSSNPGDIVADFFCGSGTTLAASEKLGRRWLGCDLSTFAVQVTRKRLLDIHNSKSYYFPLPGEALSIPLRSQNDREEFLIDINRGRIRLTKCTYQERHNAIIILVRLDVDGPPHTNPDLSAVPLPYLVPYNGKTIDCPHLHLYVEGFMDKWAIPAPNDKFGNTTDLYKTLQDFFGYCNVIDPPTIQKSITQRRLFP